MPWAIMADNGGGEEDDKDCKAEHGNGLRTTLKQFGGGKQEVPGERVLVRRGDSIPLTPKTVK